MYSSMYRKYTQTIVYNHTFIIFDSGTLSYCVKKSLIKYKTK